MLRVSSDSRLRLWNCRQAMHCQACATRSLRQTGNILQAVDQRSHVSSLAQSPPTAHHRCDARHGITPLSPLGSAPVTTSLLGDLTRLTGHDGTHTCNASLPTAPYSLTPAEHTLGTCVAQSPTLYYYGIPTGLTLRANHAT